MAALSAVLEVQNANGERVDLALRQPGGGYLPVNLVIGAGLSATAARNGPVVEVTIAADAGAGVTAVTADAPLTSSGGTTPNLTIATADGSNRGAMPSAHWTLVNGATPEPTPETLVLRDAGGRAKFDDPIDDEDAAPKAYVDIRSTIAAGYYQAGAAPGAYPATLTLTGGRGVNASITELAEGVFSVTLTDTTTPCVVFVNSLGISGSVIASVPSAGSFTVIRFDSAGVQTHAGFSFVAVPV